MATFRNLAVKYIDEEEEQGYPTPERELLWRLEDLMVRREEVIKRDYQRKSSPYLPGRSVQYFLPKDLFRVYDIEMAIELAINDLEEKYDIGEETLSMIGLIP